MWLMSDVLGTDIETSLVFFFLSSFIYPGFHTGLALLLVFTEFPALVLNF